MCFVRLASSAAAALTLTVSVFFCSHVLTHSLSSPPLPPLSPLQCLQVAGGGQFHVVLFFISGLLGPPTHSLRPPPSSSSSCPMLALLLHLPVPWLCERGEGVQGAELLFTWSFKRKQVKVLKYVADRWRSGQRTARKSVYMFKLRDSNMFALTGWLNIII